MAKCLGCEREAMPHTASVGGRLIGKAPEWCSKSCYDRHVSESRKAQRRAEYVLVHCACGNPLPYGKRKWCSTKCGAWVRSKTADTAAVARRAADNKQWRDSHRAERAAAARAWKLANPDRVRESARAAYARSVHRGRGRLLARYGLTAEQYDAMYMAQGGACAICGNAETRTHAGSDTPNLLAIDHDHACCPGKDSCGRCVRGLLCAACNTAVGLLGDNARVLRDAAGYLEMAA